ncbi:MFS transporter [Nocardia takedensis]|uniref:MFS transporter n=1 Tax=Nocardia takedensis TaxID=259390 RepID=UPI003F770917
MTATGSAALTAADPRPRDRAARAVLAGCLVAVFLQMLDLTMVNTALPALTAGLGAGDSGQLLIASAYSLAFACGLLPAARLGDTVGRRRIYLTGMAGLILAAVWSAAAHGTAEMVAARGAQGLCAALVSAQTLAVIASTFDRSRHPRVFGLYGGAAGLAAITGPLIAGVLLGTDPLGIGWRAVFLVHVPLGLLALALMRRGLPADGPAVAVRLDTTGILLATPALLGLLYPLTRAPEIGWPPTSVATVALASALALVFLAHQRRVRASGATPLLRVDLFADRGFAVGAVLMVLSSAMLAAFPLTVSVFLQTGMGLSATESGLMIVPFALGAAAGALSSPLLTERWGPRGLAVGATVFAVAIGAVALLIDPGANRVDTAALATPVVLAGLGAGWFAAPLPSVLIADIAPEAAGAASGTVPTLQQIGSALGPAAFGAVLYAGIAAGRVADPATRAATVAHTYATAFTTVLWVIACLAAVLAAVSLALPARGR